MTCRFCSREFDNPIVKPSSTIHSGGAQHCPYCDRFIGWAKKEQNIQKRPKNGLLPSDLGIDFCELCMRSRTRLGKNETLIAHHIIEIQDGGKDEKENIWVVCTHCHVLIHHVRRYLNLHFKDLWDKYEQEKTNDTCVDDEKPPWE